MTLFEDENGARHIVIGDIYAQKYKYRNYVKGTDEEDAFAILFAPDKKGPTLVMPKRSTDAIVRYFLSRHATASYTCC